jgi:uncharacterized protein
VKLVIDTNVLLAAFAARGLCEALVPTCLRTQDVVLSQYILEELDRNLTSKLKVSTERASEISRLLCEYVRLVEPAPLPPDAFSDPGDIPVLGTAIAAGADALVTGDTDLLELGQFRGVAILSPRGLYDRLVEPQ